MRIGELLDRLERCPVVAAVRENSFSAALAAPVEVLFCLESHLLTVRRRTEQALAGYSGLAAAYSGSYVEIYSKAATKGTALAAVARQLSISKDEIACIGDGENDIPMFQEAGLRFAMGNAAPELKALADAVVASNNENGVAEAIRRILA